MMINQIYLSTYLYKKHILILLTMLLMFVFTTPAVANEEIDKTVQDFFTELSKNNINSASKVIVGTTDAGSIQDLPEQLKKLKLSLSNLSTTVGVYAGNEKIAEKTIGENFVHVQYLGYFTQEPIHFKFSFYRYKKEWRVLNFSFAYDFAEQIRKLVDQNLISTNISE